MDIDTLIERIDSAPGCELSGILPNGRKCVIQHGKETWDCWIYVGDAIHADAQWWEESIDDLIVTGREHYQIDLLKATFD